MGSQVFYHLNKLIQSIWVEESNLTIAGIGYTLPYLEKFNSKNNQIIALQPAQQGILERLNNTQNISILIDEGNLPLPDQSIDRILCIHSVEFAHYPDKFFKEIWRVLKGNGKILVITPNRRSLWAQMDTSPFGYGQPYTMTQLLKILQKNNFTSLSKHRGLFTLPHQNKLNLRLIEQLNRKFLPKFSGIVAIEAVKQIYSQIHVVQKSLFKVTKNSQLLEIKNLS